MHRIISDGICVTLRLDRDALIADRHQEIDALIARCFGSADRVAEFAHNANQELFEGDTPK